MRREGEAEWAAEIPEKIPEKGRKNISCSFLQSFIRIHNILRHFS